MAFGQLVYHRCNGNARNAIPSMANNNITRNIYSDEWYTDQKTVDFGLELLQPKRGGWIMCPFDSSKSLYVQTLLAKGFNVIYGITDFLENDLYEFDYLITNPPFSVKDQVIEQVYKYGKPSLLMLPLDSLGGVKRASLYAKYGYPFVTIPTRRVAYYDENASLRKGAAFHSVYSLFNAERTGIQWEQFNG